MPVYRLPLHMTNLFSGITILDLTRVFAGPLATRHFADFGARVIKVEPPQGDDSRHYPPQRGDWSGYFELLNRNKQSIVIDLKNETGQEQFTRLCQSADVVVENFSPSVKKKLRISYKDLREHQPKLIYASLSGVHQDKDEPYYDILGQAESGLASLSGTVEEDMKIGPGVVDAFSGMKLAFAISSALLHRDRTGKGQSLSVSMRGSAFDLLEQSLIEYSVEQRLPEKPGNGDTAIAPFGLFRAQNGMLAIAAGNEKLWKRLEALLFAEKDDYSQELFASNVLRIKHQQLLRAQMEMVLQKKQKEEWEMLCKKAGIPCARVHNMEEVAAEEENFLRGLLEKQRLQNGTEIITATGGIFFSQTPRTAYQAAPEQGANNADYGL